MTIFSSTALARVKRHMICVTHLPLNNLTIGTDNSTTDIGKHSTKHYICNFLFTTSLTAYLFKLILAQLSVNNINIAISFCNISQLVKHQDVTECKNLRTTCLAIFDARYVFPVPVGPENTRRRHSISNETYCWSEDFGTNVSRTSESMELSRQPITNSWKCHCCNFWKWLFEDIWAIPWIASFLWCEDLKSNEVHVNPVVNGHVFQ